MKLLTAFSICILVGLIGFPTIATAFEPEKYLHVAKGAVVATGRGLAITDDELETARTEDFSVGFQLTPALRFSSPLQQLRRGYPRRQHRCLTLRNVGR